MDRFNLIQGPAGHQGFALRNKSSPVKDWVNPAGHLGVKAEGGVKVPDDSVTPPPSLISCIGPNEWNVCGN